MDIKMTEIEATVIIAMGDVRTMTLRTIATRESVQKATMSAQAKKDILNHLRTTFQNGCEILLILRQHLSSRCTDRPSHEELGNAFLTMSADDLNGYIAKITD